MTIEYCVEADLDRLLSSYGVEAFADHDEDGSADAGVIDDCIEQASDELTMWTHDRYTEAVLATSRLVTRWTTTIAAYFLCQRRGNPVPESLEAEYERVIEILKEIGQGKQQIPGLELRADLRPTWSNLQVDRRHRRTKTRVTVANSSDPPTTLTQNTTTDFPTPEY